MPRIGPLQRHELIKALRQLGFSGPYSGGKHQFMTKGDFRLRIPNPHRGDIGKNLIARILAEAGITKEEWETV